MEAVYVEEFQIQSKKCINNFKNSECKMCLDVCSQGAISNGVIDMNKCNACGLCLSVCPSKAVISSIAYQKIIERYTQQKKIFSCQKKGEESLIPCLAFLDVRLLFSMAQNHDITVDLSKCRSCHSKILTILKSRLNACNTVLVSQGKIPVHILEQTEERYLKDVPHEMMNRRLFLKQSLRSMISFLELVKTNKSEEACMPCYFEKYIRNEVSEKDLVKNPLFFSCVVNEHCNTCGLCTMLCPQKALRVFLTTEKFVLQFDKIRCYQCHICENNCAKRAILITKELKEKNEFSISLRICKQCGQAFLPIENSEICIKCYQQSKIFK